MNKLLKFLIVITICLFSVQIAWPMASSDSGQILVLVTLQ